MNEYAHMKVTAGLIVFRFIFILIVFCLVHLRFGGECGTDISSNQLRAEWQILEMMIKCHTIFSC